MPSPIGHLLAGITVGLATDQRQQVSALSPRPWIICGLLALSPDLDLIVPGFHRAATHSLFAVALVFLTAAMVTRLRRGRVQWRLAMACALAYGTHVLTDYFGVDPGTPAGIQLLWPWSQTHFISDWALFPGTERHDPFSRVAMRTNALAFVRELLLLSPLLVLFWLRRRRLSITTAERDDWGGQDGRRPDRRAADRFSKAPDGQ